MTATEDSALDVREDASSSDRARFWQAIEAQLRPYVDRSLAPHAWRHSALEARNGARWREAREEALVRLGAEALLARTETRMLAFWRGNHSADVAPAAWPFNDAQRAAIRGAAAAASPAERLCAIADLLEGSPYFDWFSSSEALDAQRALDEAQGEYFSDRFYRAFNRPDLAPGTYTKANVGLIAAKEAPRHRSSAPLAVCADARGWAALLWGHPRNRWEWEDPEPFVFSDHPSAREYMRRYHAAREGGEHIQITWPVVGVSFFTALARFDGLALNAAAGRLLGLDETQTQWLGASAWEGGPYWDEHVCGRDMAEVCRAVARGEDARDAWYARRIPRLSLEGHAPSCAREDKSAQDSLDHTPAFAERPSTLIGHALGVARALDRGVYRPMGSALHRWNAALGTCEIDLAGMLLAGEMAIRPRATADEIWAHMLRGKGLGPALRAIREMGFGDVPGAVATLGCRDAQSRHREALETMAFAAADYESWDEAETHFRTLEALARRLRDLGL